MIIFDSTFLVVLLHRDPPVAMDRENKPVSQFKERVTELAAHLDRSNHGNSGFSLSKNGGLAAQESAIGARTRAACRGPSYRRRASRSSNRDEYCKGRTEDGRF